MQLLLTRKCFASLGQNLLPLAGTILFSLLSVASKADIPTLAQRRIAAESVVANDAACRRVSPFYWEIGTDEGRQAGASVGNRAPQADTDMNIASASKWIFGAYLVQLRGGKLTPQDIQALTMQTGYTHFRYGSCVKWLPSRKIGETVASCLAHGGNDQFSPAELGRFYYGGGHYQHYASESLHLGALNNTGLQQEISNQLGPELHLRYDSPQLAAGVASSADGYARFLQKLLRGQLALAAQLGRYAVCTNPATCSQADNTPIPANESWHYSLGHWVEDDPNSGDGAFSSPGAFGFYPWIDAQKQFYGILARHELSAQAAYHSVLCGRSIRRAWRSGKVD